MEQIAFLMRLKPGQEEEYRKRHDEIWPELKAALTAAGIRDYSIFHDPETDILFAFHRVTKPDRMEDLFAQPVMQKWFVHMSDIMETNPDRTPAQVALNEVFHID